MKPLIWKELRENLRWMPIGLLVVAAVCWMVYPSQNNRNLSLASALLTQLAIVTPLLAFGLGVVQTYRDLQPAAGAYLNHRGVTKDDLFWAKIVAGFVLYITAIVVPMMILAIWIGYQGMWWQPIRPAQVIPALVFALVAFGMHPAAMLMMARNASWWGTKWFPLVPAAMVLVPFYAYLTSAGLHGAAWCLIFAILTLAWMIFTARQGWRELSTDPPAYHVNRKVLKRWLLPTHLLIGTTLCYFTAVVFTIEFVEDASRPRLYTPLPLVSLATEAGTDDVWLVTSLQEYNSGLNDYTQKTLGGERVKANGLVNAMAKDAIGKKLKPLDSLMGVSDDYWSHDGFFTSPHVITNLSFVYDFRGYVLVYEHYPQMRWIKTISMDGTHPPGELVGRPFKNNPLGSGVNSFATLMNQGYPLPFISDEGVFYVDSSPIELRRIIDLPVEAAVAIETSKTATPRIILRAQNKLYEYRLLNETGSEDWIIPPNVGANGRLAISAVNAKLHADLVQTFTIPEELLGERWHWIALTPESMLLAKVSRAWKDHVVYRLHPDGSNDVISFSVAPESIPSIDDDKFGLNHLVAGTIPGIVFLILATVTAWMFVTQQPGAANTWANIVAHPIESSSVVVTFIVVAVLAMWIVRGAAYRRGLSVRQTGLWTWLTLLFGLATPLAVIAIYRLVYREPCAQCKSPRRVDEPQCANCGADWPTPRSEGIEIIDGAEQPSSQFSAVLNH